MEIFMDMGMLLMAHTLQLVPQSQQLTVRCLLRNTSTPRIISLLLQFLLPLKVTSSLLPLLIISQQLREMLPKQPQMVFLMVLPTVTAELRRLGQATKIHR
jgi:hypothetical protein